MIQKIVGFEKGGAMTSSSFTKKILLAGILRGFHFFIIAVVVIGNIVAIVIPLYRPIHFFIIVTIVLSELVFKGCPLTKIEDKTREGKVAEVGFIARYAMKWFHLYLSRRAVRTIMQLFLAPAFILFGVWLAQNWPPL